MLAAGVEAVASDKEGHHGGQGELIMVTSFDIWVIDEERDNREIRKPTFYCLILLYDAARLAHVGNQYDKRRVIKPGVTTTGTRVP